MARGIVFWPLPKFADGVSPFFCYDDMIYILMLSLSIITVLLEDAIHSSVRPHSRPHLQQYEWYRRQLVASHQTSYSELQGLLSILSIAAWEPCLSPLAFRRYEPRDCNPYLFAINSQIQIPRCVSMLWVWFCLDWACVLWKEQTGDIHVPNL